MSDEWEGYKSIHSPEHPVLVKTDLGIKHFDYFKYYPIRLGNNFNFITINNDGVNQKLNLPLPGIYVAHAVSKRNDRIRDRNIDIVINAAALGIGIYQYSALMGLTDRAAKIARAFAITDISSASLGLFLESTPLCDPQGLSEIPSDFCEDLRKLILVLDAASLTGSFISAGPSSLKYAEAKMKWDGYSSTKRGKIVTELNSGGLGRGDALVAFFDKTQKTPLEILTSKFDEIIDANDGSNQVFVNFLSKPVLAKDYNKLLNLSAEIIALGGQKGSRFINDLISSLAPTSSSLGFNLNKLKSLDVQAWNVLDDLGVDQVIRTNLTHLENVNGYFVKYPNRTSADLATTGNQFDNIEDYLNVLPDITQNSLVKGTRFNHFSDPEVTNYNGNFSHAEYSFSLWKNNKWDELEDFFNANNLNGGWPPNEGFKNVVNSETGAQLVGKKFDRFQGPGDISGGFASPVHSGDDIGDLFFTYDSRALKYNITEGTQYILFEVKSSVPSGLKFDYGEVTPWFGKQGLGDQVKSSMRLEDVKDHLKIIDTKTYINGQWQ